MEWKKAFPFFVVAVLAAVVALVKMRREVRALRLQLGRRDREILDA